MADRSSLRLSAALALAGAALVTVVVLFLHPGGGATIEDTFAAYAASADWTAVHLGQFVGMAGILAGLLVLYVALDVAVGPARWLAFYGAVSAGVGLALAAVQFAVDGVANKQADVAWVGAPAAERAARFASAQAIRWLEWGTASYLNFMVGLALALFAVAIAWTGRVPRPIGYLMGVSGLAYLAAGWDYGTTGFTPATTLPTDAGYTLLVAAMIWLLVVAWRMNVEGGRSA